VALGLQVIHVLDDIGFDRVSLDAGSLLAAVDRNGVLIPNDDDFDLLMVHEDVRDMVQWYTRELAVALTDAGLNHRLLLRSRGDYADKIEVYVPSSGRYKLEPATLYGENADFHHVTVDLQLLTTSGELCHNSMLHRPHQPRFCVRFDQRRKIALHGRMFPVMNRPKQYLQALYGYIGADSVYNADTGLYQPRDDSEKMEKENEKKHDHHNSV